MKKIYSALALAMAVSLSANAKTFDVQNADVQQMRSMQNLEAVSQEQPAADNGMKRICNFKSIEDLYGYYRFSCYVGLEGHEDMETNTIQILPSDKDGYVTVVGFWLDCTIEGKVDLANQTITFEKQFAFKHQTYGDIYWTPAKWNPGGQSGWSETNKTTVMFNPNGVTFEDGSVGFKGWITFTDMEELLTLPVIQNGSTLGWFQACYALLIQNFNEYVAQLPIAEVTDGVFEYNVSEWSARGTAPFTDGFMAPGFNTTVPAYNVNVYRNNANPGLILLENPYGAGTPYEQANTATKPGYIMLDIANPSLVKVVPFVYSGFTDYGTVEFFFSNQAGVMSYLNGDSDADILDAMDIYGYPIPEMDESYVVKIPDVQYSMNINLLAYGDWINSETNEVIESEAVIELNQDIVGAVEGITDDVDVNAPKRFYNMQGVEVVNPAAGELVIVKQGSKATKVIVK